MEAKFLNQTFEDRQKLANDIPWDGGRSSEVADLPPTWPRRNRIHNRAGDQRGRRTVDGPINADDISSEFEFGFSYKESIIDPACSLKIPLTPLCQRGKFLPLGGKEDFGFGVYTTMA